MEWKDLGRRVLGVMIPHAIPSLTTDLLGPWESCSTSLWAWHLTLLIKKKKTKKYFLYMSFTLVHLFPLQSLESHVTKKAHPSQHQLLLLFCLGPSMQDLVTIWILRIQRTCLNSLLRCCCCCILERELLLLSNKNFPGCSHLIARQAWNLVLTDSEEFPHFSLNTSL